MKNAEKRCSQNSYAANITGDKSATGKYYDFKERFKHKTLTNGSCLEWVGGKSKAGYPRTKIDGTKVLVHRKVWEDSNGAIPDGLEIDHICHNPSCVKLEHLRLATTAQNNAYRSGPRSDSTSGARNVYESDDKWVVRVGKNYKSHYFGRWSTIEEAAEVADRVRKQFFGEFAGKG